MAYLQPIQTSLQVFLPVIPIILTLVILGLILQFIRNAFSFNIKSFGFKTSKQNYTYTKQEYLLTPNEQDFYRTLSEAIIGTNFYICPKVRLMDLLKTEGEDYNSRWIAKHKVIQKHIDFIITNKNSMKIICGIELDDSTHDRYDRERRDEFVNEVFETIGVKLFHYRGTYSQSQILNDLNTAMNNI
jgi:flagellar biosynthesis protein FlhB